MRPSDGDPVPIPEGRHLHCRNCALDCSKAVYNNEPGCYGVDIFCVPCHEYAVKMRGVCKCTHTRDKHPRDGPCTGRFFYGTYYQDGSTDNGGSNPCECKGFVAN